LQIKHLLGSGTLLVENAIEPQIARHGTRFLYQVNQRRAAYLTATSTQQDRKNANMDQESLTTRASTRHTKEDPLVPELRLLCRDEVALIEAPALIIEEGRARQPISL
jgi:hypothetical protein